MRLSKDFVLAEFLVSQTASRNDIEMAPPPEVVANLQRLCQDVLQPLRTALGQPVIVTSGYRPPELNRMIGGSSTSQHMAGEAADIRAVGYDPEAIWRRLEKLSVPVHQLILEFGSWVHVSVPPNGDVPARELMTAVRQAGQTQYLNGLHV